MNLTPLSHASLEIRKTEILVVFENRVESLEVAIEINIGMVEIVIFKILIIMVIIIEVLFANLEEIEEVSKMVVQLMIGIDRHFISSSRNRGGGQCRKSPLIV